MLFGVFAAVALHFLVLLLFLGLSFTAFFRSFCLFSVVSFVLSLFLSLVLSFVLFFCGSFGSIFVCFIRVISVDLYFLLSFFAFVLSLFLSFVLSFFLSFFLPVSLVVYHRHQGK